MATRAEPEAPQVPSRESASGCARQRVALGGWLGMDARPRSPSPFLGK